MPKSTEDGQVLLNSTEAVQHLAALSAAQDAFVQYLGSAAPAAQVLRRWSVVYNGLAVALNGADTAVLLKGPGVAAVTPSRTFLPTMNVSGGVIGADTLWSQVGGAGQAGRKIKVGVIDSGIDHQHPFLADPSLPKAPGFPKCDVPENCNLTSNKVIVAREYPQSDEYDAKDMNGHGTHVSGTVAGVHGTPAPFITTALSGVAPKAYLGNYNVFPGTTAGASEYDIMDAVEDSVKDRMNVLNLSLGGTALPPIFEDPLADAVNAATDAGLVVAVAAGNSGPGAETIASPGIASKVITAGATTNPHFVGIGVGVTSAGAPADLAQFGGAVGDFAPYETPLEKPLVDWNAIDGPLNGEACQPIAPGLLEGRIAFIRRGTCPFTTKVRNAEIAGAAGVLISNNVAGDPVAMGHDGTEPKPKIPAVMISVDRGRALQAYAAANNCVPPATGCTVKADGTSRREILTTNGDIIAGFSSRGPSPYRYEIKPDVSGPGVNIYSSTPGAKFALFQGTSMASPHVAGAAAVLRQLFGMQAPPQQIKSALTTTAARPVTDHVQGTRRVGVMHRGTGRMDLTQAGRITGFASPSNVSFGKQLPVAFTETRTIVITNSSRADESYTIAVEPTVSNPSLTVTTSAAAVTLKRRESTTVTITLANDGSAPMREYEGDIVITPASGGPVMRVPYWVVVSP